MDVDLRRQLGAVQVPWAVLAARGPDAPGYLQGQLSQDVAGLAIGATTWSLLLQPNGKVVAWLRVTRTGAHALLLDAPLADPAPVLARLERFKLQSALELSVQDWAVTSYRGPGAAEAARRSAREGDLALPAGWPGVEGADVLRRAGAPGHDTELAAPAAPRDAWEALRVELGVPVSGRDLTAETIPAEAGAWLIESSVSFTKGCYTGQELVARIDSRGANVPRPLRGLRLAAPAPAGARLLLAGKQVGAITSPAHSPALGPIALGWVARSVPPASEVEVAILGEPPTSATVVELPMQR